MSGDCSDISQRERGELEVRRARTLWRSVERFLPGAEIGADPDGRPRQIVVLSGWVAEARILLDGRRQIFAFLLPGDVARVSGASGIGSRGLLALTNV